MEGAFGGMDQYGRRRGNAGPPERPTPEAGQKSEIPTSLEMEMRRLASAKYREDSQALATGRDRTPQIAELDKQMNALISSNPRFADKLRGIVAETTASLTERDLHTDR